MHVRHVILAMSGADLPAATVKIGVNLLALAHPDNGQISLTWDQYLALTNGVNRRAAQRHLTRLQQTRIIHYSTNDRIYITFTAWLMRSKQYTESTEKVQYPKPDAPPPLHPNGTWPQPDALFQREFSTETARIRAASPHTPLLSVVCLQDHHPDTDKQSSQPDARTVALLTDPDVGLDFNIATQLAAVHTFDWVQKQVATWYTQLQQGRSTGAGGLLHRLSMKWGPGPFPDRFRHTDLYHRHWHSAWELATLSSDQPDDAQDTPQAEPPHAAPPRFDPSEPATPEEAIWAAALADMAQHMTPTSFETWLRPIRLHSLQDNLAIIQAPTDQIQTWLTDHFLTVLRRTLSSRLRRAIAVQIVVPTHAPDP